MDSLCNIKEEQKRKFFEINWRQITGDILYTIFTESIFVIQVHPQNSSLSSNSITAELLQEEMKKKKYGRQQSKWK